MPGLDRQGRPTPSKSRPTSGSPPRWRPGTASRRDHRTNQRAARPVAGAEELLWRARAQAPGATGSFSDPFKFTIGGAITLGAPLPIGPLTNAETTSRPALRVSNVSRIGATGPISYRFEIAGDSGFLSLLITGNNSEGLNETGFIPTIDLPTRARLFWRAFAIDASNA